MLWYSNLCYNLCIIIITPRLDSLGVYIIDNTSNNDLSSKITVLQNNQYIKHIVVNGTISNNIITYDFSALKKPMVYFSFVFLIVLMDTIKHY